MYSIVCVLFLHVNHSNVSYSYNNHIGNNFTEFLNSYNLNNSNSCNKNYFNIILIKLVFLTFLGLNIGNHFNDTSSTPAVIS